MPVSLSNRRYTRLKPGFVILPTFSLIFIFGMTSPLSFSTAHSLYTPPNTGSDFEVMSRSPTPNESIFAPWSKSSVIRRSSRAFDTVILHSGQPASSSIALALRVRYAMSPESKRMPHLVMPSGRSTSLKALMALGTPLLRELYVSTSRVAFVG